MFNKLIAKIPAPQNDPTPLGWLKRYILEWLIPTSLSCIGVYFIGFRFLEPFTTEALKSEVASQAQEANNRIVDTMMKSIVDGFAVSNSPYFHFSLWALGTVSFLLIIYQYLKFGKDYSDAGRRKFHIVHPMTYWTFYIIIKIITIISGPLALVLAAAISVKETNLQCFAIFYLAMLAIVTAPIYHLMHYDLHSPFIVTVRVVHNGKSRESINNAKQTNKWLRETCDQLAEALGGVWVSSVIINQDGKSGVLSVGFPKALSDYDMDRINLFNQIILTEKEKWNKRKFSYIDLHSVAKKSNTKK